MSSSVDFSIEVRPLTAEYAELAAAAEKISLGSEAWTADAINATLAANGYYFAAFCKNTFLGHVGFTSVLDEGYITNIVVLPEFRHRGVATALMEHIFGFAVQTDLSFLSLEVRESNSAAIGLYTGLGFTLRGRRRKFYSEPTEDALIMTRDFK